MRTAALVAGARRSILTVSLIASNLMWKTMSNFLRWKGLMHSAQLCMLHVSSFYTEKHCLLAPQSRWGREKGSGAKQ